MVRASWGDVDQDHDQKVCQTQKKSYNDCCLAYISNHVLYDTLGANIRGYDLKFVLKENSILRILFFIGILAIFL